MSLNAMRTFRISDELWDRVMDKSEAEGIPVARVIRDLLEAWVDKPVFISPAIAEAASEVAAMSRG